VFPLASSIIESVTETVVESIVKLVPWTIKSPVTVRLPSTVLEDKD